MMMGKCTAMQDGFRFFSAHDPCILFLFPGWNVDTGLKYAFALFGLFGFGLSNEVLIYARQLIVSRTSRWSSLVAQQLTVSLLYGLHMLLAYAIMLLVMTYDLGFLLAVLLGLISGHCIFGLIRARSPRSTSETTPIMGAPHENHSLSTPCCQSTN